MKEINRMDKPYTGGSRNRRAREIVGSGFTVKDQIVGKVGLRGYGALLDQLAKATRPPKGRKPKINRPVRKPVV
jgi:hypothetical protein